MRASRFIARKLRFKGKLAMVSMAISFFVIILAVSVAGGFRIQLRDAISQLAGDVRLMPVTMDYVSGTNPLPRNPSFLQKVEALPYVDKIVPTVYRAGIVKQNDNISGVVFKGLPDGPDSLGAYVPSHLADQLGLKVGDDLTAFFVGERVRARKFKVREIYPSVLDTDDQMLVYASLKDMQRVNLWPEDSVSCLEISLRKGFRSKEAISAATDEIGEIEYEYGDDFCPMVATSLIQTYPNIFSWLDLIDLNVLMILILMTLVAGFNMISGLLIMLFRNISTIGILKSMGMTSRDISATFLRAASALVLKGMALGNGLALAFCLLQGTTHFIRLNPENYFLSWVPVHVDPLLIFGVDLVSWLAIMLLLLLPCLFVSRVDPAKTVRAQ